ncbi:MAG TPA: sugar phosphate nucleotidyltransferase [Patescibacteria group bacterium]|nr:sugar phosphate nucleotidyltransferase [Patescibacteria group bacterium]
MKALILAGGFGTKLKEVIHDRPKVMAPINGKPFLEHVISQLKNSGIEEIIISIGYLGDYISNYFGDGEDFGVDIKYSIEDYPLGTAGALKKAEKYFNDTFLTLNGDTFLDTDLSRAEIFHKKRKGVASILIVKRKTSLETAHILLRKDGKIKSYVEKPKLDQAGYVSSGYYICNLKIFDHIDPKKRLSLENDIFPVLAKKNLLYGYTIKEDFIDVGTPERYKEVISIFSKEKIKVVEAKAPVRISFAGGGSDVLWYFKKYGGKVVSGSINKYANILITENKEQKINILLLDFQRQEAYPLKKYLAYDGSIFDLYKAVINRLGINRGIDIVVRGDVPPASGLGSSSAVTVALIGGLLRLTGRRIIKENISRLAVEVERDLLKIPGGWQDQFASAFGGLNLIEFTKKGDVKITALNLNEIRLKKIEKSLLLFYLGAKRSEKEQQEYLKTEISKKNKKTIKSMETLKYLAEEFYKSLEEKKVKELGLLLDQAWQAKKSSSKKVTTDLIDRIYKESIKKGAWGGKILGAGGGGCFLVCAPANKHKTIIRSLTSMGLIQIPFNFEFGGLQVKLYET